MPASRRPPPLMLESCANELSADLSLQILAHLRLELYSLTLSINYLPELGLNDCIENAPAVLGTVDVENPPHLREDGVQSLLRAWSLAESTAPARRSSSRCSDVLMWSDMDTWSLGL